MFRTLIYPSSGACDCVDELPHRSSCSQFVVCWSFCCGWCLVVFVLQAEACKTGLLPALKNSPVPSIQTLIQPAELQLVPLCVLHMAWKLGDHSLLGGKSIQAHYLEPAALPGRQDRHPGIQPVLGHFVVADHNNCPFSPV